MNRDTVYLRYPAAWWHDIWREGLVSGNGKVGANVYGGVKDETVMLTHHKLWHGGKESELPDVSGAFHCLREMMDAEQFKEASWTVVNALKEQGYQAKLQSPFPAADFNIRVSPVAGFTDYVRGVQMNSGEVFSAWQEGDSVRRSELFVSRAQDVIVKRITSSKPDLNVTLSLSVHQNTGSDSLEKYGRHILESQEVHADAPCLRYTARNDDGTLYGVCTKAYCTGGLMETERDTLKITGAESILVLIKVFAGETQEKEAVLVETLHSLDVLPTDYDALLAPHKAIHEAWYRSADLKLSKPDKWHSNEELLLEAYSGRQSVELIEKLWRYGRYLFISGTDETTDPFPMYGLWGGDHHLMWPHNMANENIQMIYWHTFAGNLLPFHKAFFRYYNDRLPAFEENARKLFGMRGIYMTAGTTPGVSAPNQVVPVIMNWVGAAGWIAQHYDQYARYTRDDDYFQEVLLPYLLEVADFYEDFVEYYPDGSIHFYPSVSPENTPGNFMPPPHRMIPHPMPTTVNSTIDLAILKEFFTHMCALTERHPALKDRMPTWEKLLAAIPAYRMNSQGAVKEWQDDRFEERYDHRHLSHIYPVFPGKEINSLHGKELLPAFEKAVRLREIDAQTGWSMAHMASIFARLEKGEDALDCLNKMARSCLTNSFFTLHNDWRGMNISWNMDPAPVQLDAIMGYVNAVQEMLIYSSDDLLKLLPALSQELNAGEIKDFRYQDGSVNMRWNVEQGEFSATLTALRDHTVWLQLPEAFATYKYADGTPLTKAENGLCQMMLHTDEACTITTQ